MEALYNFILVVQRIHRAYDATSIVYHRKTLLTLKQHKRIWSTLLAIHIPILPKKNHVSQITLAFHANSLDSRYGSYMYLLAIGTNKSNNENPFKLGFQTSFEGNSQSITSRGFATYVG